jgi:Amt family ammonium transporter
MQPPSPPPAVEPPLEGPPINPLSFEALYFGPSNVEPPPIESYQELLGGLGERPFDSPRPVTPEAAWGRTLRRFARSAVWTLPMAAVCLALSGMWGWPTRAAEPAGESPGTWLVVTVFGLILGLAGVLAMTALLSATPGRSWSVGALVLVLTGTVLLAPVLGVLALARPSVTRLAGRLGPDTAADLDNRFLDNAVSRWLGVGGLALLAAGWLSFGCAVLASGVLSRVDGYLVLCAVTVAVLAAYVSWQFLITVAAVILLAAGLGLAWTAYRLRPDGQLTT